MSSLGKSTFDPLDTQSWETEVSGSDGKGYRAQRVALGIAVSGTTPEFVLKAKDSGGTERYLLATADPQNAGSYILKVDTEMDINLSGTTFEIQNIKIGSTNQTSASLRYLYVQDDGTLYTYDTATSGAVVYELGKISSSIDYTTTELQAFSGANVYELRKVSSSIDYSNTQLVQISSSTEATRLFYTGSNNAPQQYKDGQAGRLYGTPKGEARTFDEFGHLKSISDYVGTTEGEGDFTLAYASATMLAASGLPFSPSKENILYIARVPATGSSEVFTNQDHTIHYWTNTFQVISASFASTDHFVVGLFGKKKAFDSTNNAYRTENVVPTPTNFAERQPLSSSIVFDLSGSWFSGSVWEICKGYVNAKVEVHYGFSGALHAGANTLYLKRLDTLDTSDTDIELDEAQIGVSTGQSNLYQNLYIWTPRTWNNVTASYHGYKVWRTIFDMDVNGLEGFKFALSESIGAGSTTGTLDVYYTITNKTTT